MSDCFEKGFKYVFSRDKFIESSFENATRYHGNVYTKVWVEACDGKPVRVISSTEGTVKVEHEVRPEWCDCIKKETSGSAKPTCRKPNKSSRLYHNEV